MACVKNRKSLSECNSESEVGHVHLLHKRLVFLLTLSRFGCALLVACAGVAGWWPWAVIGMLLGFTSDMLDGYLARRWQVTSRAGERLDRNARVTLVFCGLVAAIVGGTWPTIVGILLLVLWGGAYFIEPYLAGDWLVALWLAVPTVNLTVVVLLMITFVRHWLHWPIGTLVILELGAVAVVIVAKRRRIRSYIQQAFYDA